MKLSRQDLRAQLAGYRIALRAMMWLYDVSNALAELIDAELKDMFEIVEWPDLELEIDEDWDRPAGVSFDAYRDVTCYVNDWVLNCYSRSDFKATKDSIYLRMFFILDCWPAKNPEDSLSGLYAYTYRTNRIRGNRTTDCWSDLEYDYPKGIFGDEVGIDVYGNPLKAMKLKVFPDSWSAKGKYFGHYAVGLYDLSGLVGEDPVRNTVISDIRELLKQWKS